MIAADQLRCPVWELTGERPPAVVYWRDRAIVKANAEARAARWFAEHPDSP